MTITSCVAYMQLFVARDTYELYEYTDIYLTAEVNKCAIFYSLGLQERNDHYLLCQYPNTSWREVRQYHFTVSNKFFL